MVIKDFPIDKSLFIFHNCMELNYQTGNWVHAVQVSGWFLKASVFSSVASGFFKSHQRNSVRGKQHYAVMHISASLYFSC